MSNINETTIDLNEKVNEFLVSYFKKMEDSGYYSKASKYHYIKKMRDFIEKMAIWYELRYPDYEINRLMYCTSQEEKNINDIMFKNNSYINDLFDKESDVKELDWSDFYNTNAFIKSLPLDERDFLARPWYSSITYLIPNERAPFNLYLTRNGIVEKAENVTKWTNSIINDEELVGLHAKRVVELFKEKGIELPLNNKLEKSIKNADNKAYQKEEMLNCVMYRIIERGGNRIGPRRAFLFAKEFNRNIDIPMKYAVDRTDPGLRLFINEYIKAGGSKDLECYIGYFSNINKNEKIDTISIQDLILIQRNNAITFYTKEEDILHQRLINALASQVDQDIVKKEEIKKQRILRKLKRK